MRLVRGGKLREYTITDGERNDEAGKSVYAFAERDGSQFFVKKFIHVRYPEDADLLGTELTKHRLDECRRFEDRQHTVTKLLGTAAEDYGVVRTIDFFREGPDYYRIARKVSIAKGRVPLSEHGVAGASNLMRSVASAVGYFHSTGLVHGDIKLENLLVEEFDGVPRVALIDFDDCYSRSDPPTARYLGGTPSHFAPEVIAYIRSSGATKAPDIEADVFSAALVMHEIAVGRIPRFPSRDQMLGLSLLRGEPIDLSAVSPAFAGVIRPMLAVDPGDRPSMSDVYDSLATVADADFLTSPADDATEGPTASESLVSSATTDGLPLDPKLKINMMRRPRQGN